MIVKLIMNLRTINNLRGTAHRKQVVENGEHLQKYVTEINSKSHEDRSLINIKMKTKSIH